MKVSDSNTPSEKKATKKRGRTKKNSVDNTPDILLGANNTPSINDCFLSEYNYTGFLSKDNDTLVININKIYEDISADAQERAYKLGLSGSIIPFSFTDIVNSHGTASSDLPAKLNISSSVFVAKDDLDILVYGGIIINGKILKKPLTTNLHDETIILPTIFEGDLGKGKNLEAINQYITVYCPDFTWMNTQKESSRDFKIIFQVSLCDSYYLNSDYTQILQNIKVIININISPNNYHYEIWEDSIKPLYNNNSSYALIRTNPKLTGNIKLVVDNNYNLYLDTFKVSKNLSDNKYRKVHISTDGNYPRDVRQAFKSLPKGDLYKIPENLLNPHKLYTDLKDQYITTYEYGAETNSDFLYPENFRILAPLWIDNILPDFFCIFKIDSFYNKDSYNITDNFYTDTEKFKSILKECSLVKVFDLREHTPIGIYLNNYKNNYFVPKNVFLQFPKYNKLPNENEYEKPLGKNSWYGISLDTGVITYKNEICYNGNKIINSGTQEEFNAYMIGGYERNNMLIPTLLNLEFLFNDYNSEDFIMHRYFGLYLKANQLIEFACITKTENKGKIELTKYDNNYNVISDELYDNIIMKYPEKLFFAEAGNIVERIKTEKDKKLFQLKNTANKPGNNILSSNVTFRGTDDAREFITLNMKKPMEYGEHIRIITTDAKNKNTYVFEIIASNDSRLLYTEDNISPYILYNQKDSKLFDKSVYVRYKGDIQNSGEDHEHQYFGDDPFTVDPITGNIIWNEDIDDYPNDTSLYFDPDESHFNYTSYDPVNLQDPHSDLPINQNSGKQSLNYKFTRIEHYPKIFRLCFYSQDLANSNAPAQIYDQIKRINACIEKFNYKFYMGASTAKSFSIIVNQKNTVFQHITKDILDYKHDSELVLNIKNMEISETDIENLNAIYDNKKEIDTTFDYFNKLKYVSYTYPLSFDTEGYSQDTCRYAPLDFELLGWRKSAIINFMPISRYVYEISIPDTIYDYFDHMITAKALSDRFTNIYKFNIVKNAVVYVQDNLNTMNSSYLYSPTDELLYIQSPWNLDKWLIQSTVPLRTINGHINLYIPRKSSLSIMGILPIKDFDYSYTDSDKIDITSHTIYVTQQQKLYINNFYLSNSLKTNQLYFLEKGSFTDFKIPEHSYFIIYDAEDQIGYNIVYKGKKEYIAFNYITVEHDTKILVGNIDENKSLSLKEIIPGLNIYNYYKDKNPVNDLNWPIVSPVIFKWESINNQFLNIKNITNYSRPNIIYNRLFNSLNTITKLKNTNNYSSWQNIILKHLIDNPLYTFLNNSSERLIYAGKIIYNDYINILTFIYNQFVFKISLSNTIYNKNIKLYKYDNYNLYIILDYVDDDTPSEIYISEDENIFLLIIHNYNPMLYTMEQRKYHPKTPNLYSDDNFENWVSWNWKTGTYIIDKGSVFGGFDKITGTYTGYIPESNKVAIQDFAQISFNIMGDNSLQNTTALYRDFDADDYNEEEKRFKMKNSFFSNYIDDEYTYGLIDLKYGENAYNKSLFINYDLYKHETTTSLDQEFIDAITQESMILYIIKNKTYIKYTQSIINRILNIDISYIDQDIPLKYNNNYFVPKFIDIFEFYDNENIEIIENTKRSYLHGNTNIKKVNCLNDIYIHKVYSSKYNKSILPINYQSATGHSILSSSWDRNYYNIINQNSLKSINGFIPGIETKNFFGSSGIVLNDPIIRIETWPSNSVSTDLTVSKFSESNKSLPNPVLAEDNNVKFDKPKTTKSLNITLNISEGLYLYLKNSGVSLYTNWTDFTGIDKENSYNNYIKNTLIKYFNIDDKNNIKIYSYISPNPIDINDVISYERPQNFSKYTVEKNIDITYKNIDNTIFGTVSVPYTQNKKYYITVNIKSI